MRWLFLFVLFLNLSYVGWQLMQSPEKVHADVASLKEVTTIVLLSESARPVELIIIAEEAVVDEESVVEVESEIELKSEAVAMAPSSVVPVVLPKAANVPSVMGGESTEKSETVDVVQQPALEKKQVSRCFSMGPFRNVEVLSRLTQDIKSYVASTSFRSFEKKEAKMYWVYIRPEKNRKAAIATGDRLKVKKIKDFYLIREGEKLNGLSLGHFRNKKGAYSLTRKVKNLGFNVLVEPVQKTYTSYLLDYQLVKPEVDVPKALVAKYIKVNKKDIVVRVSRDCVG